jgi:uncharacterized repeat protein (TIGR02543 family)
MSLIPFRRAIHPTLTILFLVGLSVQGADIWTATGSLATGSDNHTATLLPNGKVLVAGGVNSSVGPLSRTELYDPATGIWTTGYMNLAHYAHTATLLANGKVLVAGGQPNSNLFSAELYDPTAGTWTSTGSKGIYGRSQTATLLTNGKVLVAGGADTTGGSISSAELYDPATGTWTSTGSMSSGRVNHTATLLANGKVLVAGGGDHYLPSAELYDPTTGIWTSTGSMGATRSLHTAILLANGKVLIAGGGYVSSSELYDPNKGTWTGTGSMSTARAYHTATLLTNGKVLVAGGYDGDHLVSSAELYDPVTGIWTSTDSMTTARRIQTAILLADGKVLVTGGRDDSGLSVSSVELYNSAFSITLEAASYGAITGNTSPYSSNTNATLTAAPNPGYLFTAWTGDAIGTDNPLSVLMTADKTIGATFSPDTNDTDDDGFTNYEEIVIHGTNPALPDTDGDDVKDGGDAFPLDINEWLDTDDDGTGDNADTDDDGDGLSDEDEINIHGTNPKRSDSDGDGLSDPAELQTHLTNPNIADSDQDGLSDGAEVNTHGTDPKVGDSDNDGFLDGYEVFTGKLPLDPSSKPALVAEARTAIEFIFPAAIGKSYRIEDSTDLVTWATVETGIVGAGGQVQRFYSILNTPKRYLRVEENAP